MFETSNNNHWKGHMMGFPISYSFILGHVYYSYYTIFSKIAYICRQNLISSDNYSPEISKNCMYHANHMVLDGHVGDFDLGPTRKKYIDLKF